MNPTIFRFAIGAFSLVILTSCGEEEAETPGDITAQITCSAPDSLLATIYRSGEEISAASQWCSCAGTDGCSVEFTGLGYGDYLLGVGRPDSTYMATEGAEGFSRTLGYYGQTGIARELDSATTISLSADQPSASVTVNMNDERSRPQAP